MHGLTDGWICVVVLVGLYHYKTCWPWGPVSGSGRWMECEICGKSCKRRAQVFIQGDELKMCRACVVKLRTRRLKYCEDRQRYRFNGNLRKRDLVRGRIWRLFYFLVPRSLPRIPPKAGRQAFRACCWHFGMCAGRDCCSLGWTKIFYPLFEYHGPAGAFEQKPTVWDTRHTNINFLIRWKST